MLTIGLTGGIASGKSTVAAHFAALGVPVIDADVIARELVAPGQPALADIIAEFGNGILQSDGSLNRAALRRRVFSDPAQRQRLEALLHPRIRAEMSRRRQALRAPYCILVIPLLLESQQAADVDRVLVVDSSEADQRRRLKARDGLEEAEMQGILAAQLGREARLAHADDIISNDADIAHLQAQVDALHQIYLSHAS